MVVLAVLGSLALIGLIIAGVFLYKKKKAYEELQRELARSQAGNSVVVGVPNVEKPLLRVNQDTTE